MVSVTSPTTLSVYQEDPHANLGLNTISLDFVSNTLNVKSSFTLSTMTTCSNIFVTFPLTTPQTYMVGDPANLYRINSFTIGPNPNCGPAIYYYNIKQADTGLPAPTQNYYMFNTTILDEEPALQVGQYYVNNNLMNSNLQLNLLVNLYVQVGMFQSKDLAIPYTFVDPCQRAVVSLSLSSPSLSYNIMSPPQSITMAVTSRSSYPFCIGTS